MNDVVEANSVGVDVGGTFTDFVFVRADGRVEITKRPTTAIDPSQAVVAGIQEARGAQLLAPGFDLSHGTTVATNALLERRGVSTALITTLGCRDILEIGRQARRDIYALSPVKAPALLPPDRRFEVKERIDSQGRVAAPLDEAALHNILKGLQREGVESLAICFLFAHLNAVHERRASEIARELGFAVSISSEIAAESREYERTSTVVANACVAPILIKYLEKLDVAVRLEGAAHLRVMQSNGGTLSPREAGEHAVKTALSGPAGGVIAAGGIAADVGLPRVLTIDMGGTSTDVALLINGQCPIVTLSTIGDIPLRTPMLDIHTVGAGGGSQAWIDGGGALRVGPRSAGAAPGPVAYGVGSVLTVTDANILLGRIPSDIKLAGQVPLDASRVRACFETLASKLKRPPEEIALAIVSIAQASMARALRHISIERGHDPQDFALVSFGGAGGLHGCALAESLDMNEVLIPRFPGALSALGLAIAPIRHEIGIAFPAVRIGVDAAADDWTGILDAAVSLEAEARRRRSAEDARTTNSQGELLLDMRYVGQSFELRVPFDPGDPGTCLAVFHAMHRARYGHAAPSDPAEAVTLRYILSCTSQLPALRFPTASSARGPLRTSPVHDGREWAEADLYLRDDLASGQRIDGPALILQSDSTAFIPPDWSGRVDSYGNLRLTHNNFQAD